MKQPFIVKEEIMESLACIDLKPGKEGPLRRRAPFVFSGAVAREDSGLADGDVVAVRLRDGSVAAVGHYQSRGSIRVRVLAFAPRDIDDTFWQEMLLGAWALRERLGLTARPDTNAFRLVHGEGDGLPGLVADWYDGHIVIEPHSAGMVRAVPAIERALATLPGPALKSVYVKGRQTDDAGTVSECEILESGLRFGVNWERGQKTGFFLDQRENRRLLGALAAGRRVLNLFSYSGAFSVYALQGGAVHVTSVDSSKPAIGWAEENVRRNGFAEASHRAVAGDVFGFLRETRERWPLVVVDPPAFAKHMSARHEAIQAYRRLNAGAMEHLEPGGILFTFSCSQVVTPDLFRGAVLAAAIDVGRPVRILHHLHQPPDHPVSIYHPESEYLKGYALHVG